MTFLPSKCIANISDIGLPGCLTGPVARGDLDTVERHLDALQAKDPSLLTIYKVLGLQAIPIALAKGKVNEQKAEEMKALLGHPEFFARCHSEGADRPNNLTQGTLRQAPKGRRDSSPRQIGAQNDRRGVRTTEKEIRNESYAEK